MSSEPSKIKGQVNKVLGSTKEAIGGLIGSETMQAEGAMKKTSGEAEKMAAKAGTNLQETNSHTNDNAKDTTGALTGNNLMQTEGTFDRNISGADTVLP